MTATLAWSRTSFNLVNSLSGSMIFNKVVIGVPIPQDIAIEMLTNSFCSIASQSVLSHLLNANIGLSTHISRRPFSDDLVSWNTLECDRKK